jgi:predicted dehydrogenase
MLKGVLAGCGRMGITHFSILNSHPLVDIQGVCDHSNTMLNIMNKYSGLRTYTDYKPMVDELSPDFIVISTPTDSHSEIIRFALDRGVHIFCEKPFGLTPAEGRETLQHLEGRFIVNQIGYVNRFNEVFVEVKKLIDSGLLGQIKSFSSEMYGATVLKDASSGWRSKKKSGGGCMQEFASHCIDLVIHFFGKPDAVAGSRMERIYSSNVEDLVSSTFIYNKGFSGNIFANWSDASIRKPTNIVTILGTNGKIIADKHAYKIFLRSGGEDAGFHQGWNTRYITDFAKGVRFYVRGNEFSHQLDYFIDSILDKKTNNICSFHDALQTDETMEQIALDVAQDNSVTAKPLRAGADQHNQQSRTWLGKRVWNSIWRKIHA